MKTTILKSVMIVLVALFSLNANAQTKIDGLYYYLSSGNMFNGWEHSADVDDGDETYTGEIVIPSSVVYDGEVYPVTSTSMWFLSQCYDVTSVSLGRNIKSIGQASFYECSGLKDVYCYAKETPEFLSPSAAFFGLNLKNVTLHVPSGTLDKYKSASTWKDFGEIVEIVIPTHTLTYMVDDEVYKTIEMEEGEDVKALEELTKEGYTFSGWSEIPATMPAKDVTITGGFTFVDAIKDVIADDSEYKIFTPDGKPVETLQKGVNIIRYSDGQTKKVLVK